MTVSYQDVIFAYSFDRLTSGGLLFDHGPLELHATPGAAGAAPTRQLDGSYAFAGAQYFTLAGDAQTRFYQNAPIGAKTILALCTNSINDSELINAYNTATVTGFRAVVQSLAASNTWYLQMAHRTGIAPFGYTQTGVVSNYLAPHVFCATVETTPRCVVDQRAITASWPLGAFANCVYDAATVPSICGKSGANGIVGRVYYLALLKNALASADMAQLSALIASGLKPWTQRGA